MTEDVEYDLNNICRTCLNYSADLHSVFELSASTTFPQQINSLIMSVAKVQITLDDGMPDKICSFCRSAVHQAYMYKLKCEQSEFKLRKYLEKKCQNTNIKEELQDYSLELQPDLVLNDDPFQHSFNVSLLDENKSNDNKITRRRSKVASDNAECIICSEVVDKKMLSVHMKLHSDVKCTTCNRTFAKPNQLHLHLQTHLKKEYQCYQCNETFPNKKKQKLHEVTVHVNATHKKRGRPTKQQLQSKNKLELNPSVYDFILAPNGDKYCECKLCEKTFSKISLLRFHMGEHVHDIQTLAEFDFMEKLELFDGQAMNLANHTNDSLIQYIHEQLKNGENERFYQILNANSAELNLSDSETETESEIVCNTDRFLHQHQYQCSKCDKNFNRSWKILAHMRDDHQDVEFDHKCTYCNRIYPNSVLLTKHIKRQCENILKRFSCELCNMKFMWKSSYDMHKEKIHVIDLKKEKAKAFVCNVCDKTFFRAEHLERHKKIHIPAEKKFSCDLCKKKFNRKDNLKSHMRVHKEDKDKEDGDKHLCVYCGRSFSNSSNLIVHMRRHTGEKPYKCDLCDKGFPRSSDLQCHRRTHTGEKPCLCTICGKGFSRSNKLVRHMRIHTGIRPYKCTYCDRAFTQSNDLTLHIRRHTGDKPYVCGICGDRFIQGTALQTHRRLQGHFEENQPTPFASISVNNPNRYTNANRVNRIGAGPLNIEELIKQEKSTSIPSSESNTNITSSNLSQINRPTGTAYISNGNTFLTMQTVEVPPMLTISHFQGYN